MNNYVVKVIDEKGQKKTLSESSISEELLRDSLHSRGYYVIDLKPYIMAKFKIFNKKIKKEFVLDFVYNTHSLLSFGLDINEAIVIMKDIYPDVNEKKIIDEISINLKKGGTLQESIKMADTNFMFDDFILSMISAGESGGSLVESFQLILEYLLNIKKTKESVVSSLTYPIILVFASFLAFNLLLFYIVPNFEQMYLSMNYQPSGLISLVFNLSNIVTNYSLIYLGALVTIVMLCCLTVKLGYHKLILNAIISNIPLFSWIKRLQVKIRLAFCLEIILKSGDTLEQALTKLIVFEENPVVSLQLKSALEILKAGGTVSDAIFNIKVFDIRDIRLIEVSESISKTTECFEKIHIDASEFLKKSLDKMVKLLEPAVVIAVSLFIFFVMYLVISPTLNMLDNF